MDDKRVSKALNVVSLNKLIRFLSVHNGTTKEDVKELFVRNLEESSKGNYQDSKGKEFNLKQITRRKSSYPDTFIDGILNYLKDCDADALSYIYSNIFLIEKYSLEEELDKRLNLSLGKNLNSDENYNSISSVFGSIESIQRLTNDFIEKSTNDNGNYILFSPKGDGTFQVGSMEVKFDKDDPAKLIPKFTTRQFSNGKTEQMISGFMMEADRYTYSFGTIAGGKNFRLGKLVKTDRLFNESGDTRRDYYGIRLGGYKEKINPNSHRIYAYQIKDKERYESAVSIITASDTVDVTIFEILKVDKKDSDVIIEYLLHSDPEIGNLNTDFAQDIFG